MGETDSDGEAASLGATCLMALQVICVVSRNHCQKPIRAMVPIFRPPLRRQPAPNRHDRPEQGGHGRKSCD
jgi:hypothetical protein